MVLSCMGFRKHDVYILCLNCWMIVWLSFYLFAWLVFWNPCQLRQLQSIKSNCIQVKQLYSHEYTHKRFVVYKFLTVITFFYLVPSLFQLLHIVKTQANAFCRNGNRGCQDFDIFSCNDSIENPSEYFDFQNASIACVGGYFLLI